MRRRPRIDLGQEVNSKESSQLERKAKRWAQVNKNRPQSENPFLAAIKPDHDNYGEPGESWDQLKARLESLEFGNYPGYFNYRNKSASSKGDSDKGTNPIDSVEKDSIDAGHSDERLGLLKEEWFRGKQVLDIGCNRGHITYAIAKRFLPQFILGVDIDLRMIHMANRDLHLHLEDGLMKENDLIRVERAYRLYTSDKSGDDAGGNKKYTEDQDHMSLSSYVNIGPLATSISDSKQVPTTTDEPNGDSTAKEADEIRTESRFPNNILFVEHNYVLARDELVDKQSACFDTIVCLSVTKWIHLNYRDEGLKRFLKRIHRHLNPGGLLVLEAQPFDNYYRKKKLSDRLRANYYSIKFRPEQIDEFLLSKEVGFREIVFSTTTEHSCVGFKRPLKVFLK